MSGSDGSETPRPAHALEAFARTVDTGSPSSSLPVLIGRACADVLGADGGALTLVPSRTGWFTLGVTDAVAQRLGDLEELLGEGPAHEAFHSGRVAQVHVGGSPGGPFPLFAELAREVGECTVHALPLRSPHGRLGVLCLHQRGAGTLAGTTSEQQQVADAAASRLLQGIEEGALPASLWSARSRIDQATGMVVAQLGLAARDALALLRARAYACSQRLEDVADDVLTGRVDLRTDAIPGDGQAAW
ncbi:ANTAR domain-containing protein [Oerskovia flava]|uniref:ANTAR domain-containing protein n=1 Tax=Oerskovia flava TaxID=2986422 RepID=UPI00223EB9D6|nr:ANTAR domain-containing protein [Oerskovia sp. JB1-3-2]